MTATEIQENAQTDGFRAALVRTLSGDSTRFRGLAALAPETALLAGFILFFEWLKRLSALPADDYQSFFIVGATGRQLLGNAPLAGGATILLLILCLCRRRLGVGWKDMEHGLYLRLIAGAATLALVWPLTFSNYNFLYAQHYYLDRLLILLCAFVFFFRPFAVLPLLLFAAPMIWMRDAEIGVFPWEFYGLPLRILALLFVWLILASVSNSRRVGPLFFVTLCIVAGHYWIPGNIKLRNGWLFENDIFYLHPSAYANGWMGFLAPNTIAKNVTTLAWFNVPMKLGTLALECGCLFMFAAKRRSMLFFLVGFAAFHFGVLLVSGIFMWQWLLVEATLVAVLWRREVADTLLHIGRWHILASILIIGLAPYWLRSARLAWFDTPVNYIFRFDAIDEQGARSNLPPQFFAPFDLQFTFSGFGYLVPEQPLLDITWGATSKPTAMGLKNAASVDDIFAFETKVGSVGYGEKQTEHMRAFLRQFITHFNQSPDKLSSIPWLSPPPGLITFPRENNFKGDGPIRRVEVTHITSYFDENGYQEIRSLPVLAVDIPLPR